MFSTTARLIVTAVVAAASLSACAGTQPRVGTTPTSTTTPTETTSPAPAPEPARATKFVVANSEKDGRIELRSSADGSLLRVLASGSDSNFNVGGITVSKAAGIVVFTQRGDGLCDDRLYSVPLAGGEATEIAEGSEPALSPDGMWLAYRGLGRSDGCGERAPLVVRNLETGDERTWRAVEWDEAYGEPQIADPHSIAWSPDSRSVVYALTTGDPAFVYFVLDRDEGDDVLDGRRLRSGDGDSWFHMVWGAEDAMFAVAQQYHGGDEPDTILRVDPATGRPTTLFTSTIFSSGFDVDPSGTILATGRVSQYGDAAPMTITWREGSEPVELEPVDGPAAWVD